MVATDDFHVSELWHVRVSGWDIFRFGATALRLNSNIPRRARQEFAGWALQGYSGVGFG